MLVCFGLSSWDIITKRAWPVHESKQQAVVTEHLRYVQVLMLDAAVQSDYLCSSLVTVLIRRLYARILISQVVLMAVSYSNNWMKNRFCGVLLTLLTELPNGKI